MRLTEIAMFTDDVDKVADFYERLLGAAPDREGEEKAVFRLGGVALLIHKREEPFEGFPPDEDHAAYAVENLDDVCRGLVAQGLRFEVGPKTFPWGKSAYLRDPDGRLLELHEEVAANV